MNGTLATYLIVVAFFAGRFEATLEEYWKERRRKETKTDA